MYSRYRSNCRFDRKFVIDTFWWWPACPNAEEYNLNSFKKKKSLPALAFVRKRKTFKTLPLPIHERVLRRTEERSRVEA